MPDFVDFIGYSASVLSTIAFLPQAWYVIKTKDVKSISLATYSIFVASVVFWFIYGCFLQDMPIVLSNVVCIVLGSIILTYKLKDSRNIKNNK